MNKATIVKSSEVQVQPFVFMGLDIEKDVTKKEIKQLAKELRLDYSEKEIVFAKKILNAYIKKNQ